MSNILNEFSKSKGFVNSNSPEHAIIKKFNETDSSKKLFSFLNKYPSCIATFNAIVKSEQADIDEIIKKHTNIFCAFDTSFIYYAECKKCKMIHNIDISEHDFKIPTGQIKCQSCQRILNFDKSDFKPLTTIQKDDLIRFFNLISEKYGLFLSKVALNCVYCADPLSPVDDDKIRNVDLLCPHCQKIRYVEPLFTIEDDIAKIIDKEDGYWLEWYIWRKLEPQNAEHNITFKQINDSTKKFDADVCLFLENKFIIIECKDTSDINRIFSKFHLISQIADKYILVSTSQIDPGKLESCKSELGDKFGYITPNQIINIEAIIKKMIKSAPKSDFTINKTTATRFNIIKFTDISLNTPTSWKWDFGDGAISDLQNPDHQYTRKGPFKVKLQVTNEAGKDVSEKVIRII